MASFVKADSWWALSRRNLPFSVGESGNWVYPFIDLFFDKFNPRRCERNVEAWFKFKTHFPSFLRGISFQHSNFALPSKHWNFSSASSFTQNLHLNLILFRNNSSHFNIFLSLFFFLLKVAAQNLSSTIYFSLSLNGNINLLHYIHEKLRWINPISLLSTIINGRWWFFSSA